MMWQHTPYTIPLIMASVVSVILGCYIWWRFRRSWAAVGALLVLASAEWTLGYALELGSSDLLAKIFWKKIQFVGTCIIPVAWLIYILHYTGHEKWITRRNVTLLVVVPVITLVLVFTNDSHQLILTDFALDTGGPFSVLRHTYGLWFWFFAAHSHILILFGFFSLVQMLIRGHRLYRWQTSALLLGSFVPWLGNMLDVSGLNPLPYLELTPFCFPLTSLTVALSLLYLRMGDIVPVAREIIIEDMSDSIIVLDSENHVVDINPSARRLIGDTTSKVIGQSIEEVWSDWVDKIGPISGKAEMGKEIVLECRGEQHIFDVRISPIVDWRGGLVSRVAVLRDITERKEGEEKLHESEEKFRTIFENASDLIIYMDSRGKIIDMNRNIEDILGYTPEEFTGRNFTELDFPGLENMPEYVDLFRDVITDDNPLSFSLLELELKHKNGNKVFVEAGIKAIKKDEKAEGALVIVRDITERKRAEEKIKQSLKEKEILLREIHHRVKNNLQVISSLLSLQSDYAKNTKNVQVLKDSQDRIRSMALIHENLYQSEDLANVDFKRYITTMVHGLFRSYRIAGNIALKIDIEDISLGIDTAIPCGLIINELVSNSLKHAFPEGKRGEISVSIYSAKRSIELIVADNGVGIPEDIDFKTTKTLGLHLVTILVEDQLEGEINLDRTKGTTFRITFGGNE